MACNMPAVPIIAPAGTRSLEIRLPVAGTRYATKNYQANRCKVYENYNYNMRQHSTKMWTGLLSLKTYLKHKNQMTFKLKVKVLRNGVIWHNF